MGQSIRQGYFREIGTAEHFELLKIGVTGIHNIVAVVALDTTDVARVEILSHRLPGGPDQTGKRVTFL
jgi:hypothetical protein